MNYLVYISLPKEADALQYCRCLLERHLAAGMNIIGPVTSLFHWQGQLVQREEYIILAQVRATAYKDFEDAAIGLHPYEVPCVVALPIKDAYGPFSQWISNMGVSS